VAADPVRIEPSLGGAGLYHAQDRRLAEGPARQLLGGPIVRNSGVPSSCAIPEALR
jgi:hypothetical protein